MIHILTMGHPDPAAVGRCQAIVLRPLDMSIVTVSCRSWAARTSRVARRWTVCRWRLRMGRLPAAG
jgi:hypothetical protein